MSELRKMIEESFEFFLKKRWLKNISKEMKKYEKYKKKAMTYSDKANIKLKVTNTLFEEYTKTFYKEGEADV